MDYEQDWIMRQIKDMTRFIAELLFHKDTVSYKITDENNLSTTDKLHSQVLALLGRFKIAEAENVLMKNYNTEDMRCLELAVDFYQRLNGLDDKQLAANGFSRAKINEGLRRALRLSGIDLLDQVFPAE